MYQPRGIITALVTPFTTSLALDTGRLRDLVEEQIEAQVHGIMVAGGSGEFVNLTDEERQKILMVSVRQADGRLPVILGVLTASTKHAIDLMRIAKDEGAAAGLVLTPYYIRPSTDGIVRHFELIANAVDLPIILYNNPGRTGINLDSETVAVLDKITTVVGMKDCERDVSTVSAKMAVISEKFSLLSGEDDLVFPTLVLGSPGAIVATSNLAPHLMVKIFMAVQSGDYGIARDIHFRILPFVRAFNIENHPGPLKEAMKMAGRSVGEARPPLQPMPAKQIAGMKSVLTEIGFPTKGQS